MKGKNLAYKIYFEMYNFDVVRGAEVLKKSFTISRRNIDKYFKAGGDIKIKYKDHKGVMVSGKINIIKRLNDRLNKNTPLVKYVEENYPEFLV
jgi:hypothetical protein